MQPQQPQPLAKLLQPEQHLEALRYIVDRVWPLQRENNLQLGVKGIHVEIPNSDSTAHIQLFLMTAVNSRTGDISIQLLDRAASSRALNDSLESLQEGQVFSSSFIFKKSPGDPWNCALFNGLCLLADTLLRDQNKSDSRIRSLSLGQAEKALETLLANPQIDFSHISAQDEVRLYCDDYQNLGDGVKAAWMNSNFRLTNLQSL